MPAEQVTPAIVLRTRDYSESDRIVTLITRDFGKLGAIAKGAKASRRRFERKLEPFSHVMLRFRRRPHGELVFITSARAEDLTPYNLEDDLGKIALGCYMLELTEALTSEEAEAAGAYRVLASALEILSRGRPNAALGRAFELKLLEWAGFGLDFRRCRSCLRELGAGGSETLFFVVARGGVVCAKCRDALNEVALKISADTVTALARLGGRPLEEASDSEPGGADGALAMSRFIDSVVGRRLRSVEFLNSVLGDRTVT